MNETLVMVLKALAVAPVALLVVVGIYRGLFRAAYVVGSMIGLAVAGYRDALIDEDEPDRSAPA